jgi:hypothetical protein
LDPIAFSLPTCGGRQPSGHGHAGNWPQEYIIGAHNDKMNISDASAESVLPNLTEFFLLVGMLI